jgi:heat shock protein HslJ
MGGESAPEERAAAPAPPLTGRIWMSTAVTVAGVPRPLVYGTRIRMTFVDGTLNVDAGCNMLSFPVAVEADRLITGEPLSTLIGCSAEREAQDEWIAGLLGNGNPGWGMADDDLTLTSGDTEIVFEAIAPWGRTYAAVSVREAGIVPAPVVPDTTIRLTFTAPDRLTAHAGGNVLGFRLAVDATRFTFDDQVSSTRMACTAALDAQDRWLMTFFTDDPDYRLCGDTLTLTRSSTTIELRALP